MHSTLQGKVFRKSTMLSLGRVADIVLVLVLTWHTERAEGTMPAARSLWVAIAISTFLTWIFLRSEENRSSCCPAFFVALAQIGPWVEAYCVRRQTGSVSRRSAARPTLGCTVPWHTEMELSSDVHRRRSSIGSSPHHSDATADASFVIPLSMISSVESPQQLGGGFIGGGEAPDTTRATAKLRVLRKMVFAQLPEVICSCIINLYILSAQWAELWWQTVVVRDQHGHICDVGEKMFNQIYSQSDNGILRRRCWGCHAPYKELFYRRTKRLGQRVFKPYDYMMFNWSHFNNRLTLDENLAPEQENDFAIFELYRNARLMTPNTISPWTCDRGYTEDVNETMGFPGQCYRKDIGMSRQWSRFEPITGGSSGPSGTDRDHGLDYETSSPWDQRSSFAIEYNFGWSRSLLHLSSASYGVNSLVDGHSEHCRQSNSWTVLPLWLEVCTLICVTFMMFASLAASISDIVVTVMVQTEFVQDHNHMVGFFYLLEVLSWWPMLIHMIRMSMTLGTERPMTDPLIKLIPCLVAYTVLILCGFVGGMPRYRQRKGLCRGLRIFAGQILLSLAICPVLLLTNLLFFDRSLTFVTFNRYYYVVRFVFITYLVWTDETVVTGAHHMGINISVGASLLLAVMLWVVVPYVLREREARIKEQNAIMVKEKLDAKIFAVCNSLQFEEGCLDGITEDDSDSFDEGVSKLRSDSSIVMASLTLSGHLKRQKSTDPEDGESAESVVQILLAVGDAFEALSLACQAHSPRVRRAILAVAIRPLAESTPLRQKQLLPLILPQLLLALRWRTVEEGQDEQCPLSSFILDRAIACKDLSLATMVYWQLFALSTDRKDDSHPTYRAVKVRLLSLLEERSFNSTKYDDEFCEQVLGILSNQRRLYYQMRVVASTASRIRATHVEKTSVLRAALASSDTFRRWHGVNCVGPSANLTRRAKSQKIGAFVHSRSRIRSACERLRDILALRFGVQKEDQTDVLREEWDTERVLEKYENLRLDLSDPQGCTLPVDPTEGVIAIDAFKSFIAHSAVQPAVYCCVLQNQDQQVDPLRSTWLSKEARLDRSGDEISRTSMRRANSRRRKGLSEDTDFSSADSTRRQLYAVKNGDDLRQDAFVIQIFRLMEMAWAENGLEDVALVPYGVLPVSTVEGMLAYVPDSKNLSKILLECEGDLGKYIMKNSEDPERSLDRLCGSTAGYCVATYLLGIGDRHLDNIMLTKSGQFFHVDFGYVLGEDPKPGAPPVRMPKEVMDVIKATGRHERFRFLVGEAFALLRRTGRLWTALVALAKAAGGNGVNVLMENDGDSQRGIHLVRSRLHLDLDETAAREVMMQEVEESAASMVAVMYDKLHQLGLFWH